MKLLDPIGGVRILAYNWVIHLTCIVGFMFVISVIPDDNEAFYKEKNLGIVSICNWYQIMHLVCFSIQIVDQYLIQPASLLIISRVINYFVEMYSVIMFILLNWTYQFSIYECRKSNDCEKHCLMPYNVWLVIETLLVISTVCSYILVIAVYWIKNSMLNKRIEHDIAK